MILIKRYSLTRVKLTALYKHLITKTTLTYISATTKNLNYRYRYTLCVYACSALWAAG